MVGSQFKTLTASPKNTRKRQRSEGPETTVSVKRRLVLANSEAIQKQRMHKQISRYMIGLYSALG